MARTFLADLIDPEVLATMISAKLPNALRVAPFATIDQTLQATAGSTITIPRYTYIGSAVDVAEGAEIPESKLGTTTEAHTVKKAAKSVPITDEALLSAFGDPRAEIGRQLIKAIAEKMDADALAALLSASRSVDVESVLSYNSLVTAIDDFEEEFNSDKVLFINPKQVTTLRLDPLFLSADQYQSGVAITGEIGRIANTRVVPTRNITATDGVYSNPLVKLNGDPETEDAQGALTVFMKRGVQVETERLVKTQEWLTAATQHYVAGVTDDSKVRLVQFEDPNYTP